MNKYAVSISTLEKLYFYREDEISMHDLCAKLFTDRPFMFSVIELEDNLPMRSVAFDYRNTVTLVERSDSKWTSLLNQTIRAILVSDDQNYMVLITDNGEVILYAYGECCSETWFADMVGVKSLLGHTVQSVKEIELPDYNTKDGRGRQEEDRAYGITFRTEAGATDLVFRNSSNGYYGGEVEIIDTRPDRVKWVSILDDWST